MTLLECMLQAQRGHRIFKKIYKEKKKKQCAIIVFSSENKICNYYALLHMDEFIKERNLSEMIIITTQLDVAESIRVFTDNRYQVVLLTSKDIQEVERYLALKKDVFGTYTDKDIVSVSLESPQIAAVQTLIKANIYTTEYIVCRKIFFLNEVRCTSKPKYTGKNKNIIKFINIEEKR